MEVKITKSEYNGRQTIVISEIRADGNEDRYPFSFGYGKARYLQAALKKEPDFIDRYLADNRTGG